MSKRSTSLGGAVDKEASGPGEVVGGVGQGGQGPGGGAEVAGPVAATGGAVAGAKGEPSRVAAQPMKKRSVSVGEAGAKDSKPLVKRKRKTFSCRSCRKLKTRCDFEPIVGKCHRCNVLKMDCSLTHERADEISSSIAEANAEEEREHELLNSSGSNSDRLVKVENQLKDVLGKLDVLCNEMKVKTVERKIDDSSVNLDFKIFEHLNAQKSNYLDNSTYNAPLNLISRIDSRLFKRSDRYSPLKDSCQEFLKFYEENKELCLVLSKSFLQTAHFWIMPGGLREISNEYVLRHPFITAVFVLLAMCFDENYQYVEEQKQLYWIVRRLLGTALLTTPLTDHDIEAVVYVSLYNIARKPHQPPLDGWIMSGMGVQHIMIAINFTGIKDRCKKQEYLPTDLFHLRILNSLCACHLQYSIGTGRPFMVPEDYFDLCELAVEYPRSNIEDNIKFAEINVAILVHKLFYQKDLFVKIIKRNDIKILENGSKIFRFVELSDWLQQWEELIHNDTSGVLMFSFEFYHVILSRRFISSFSKYFGKDSRIDKYLEVAHQTACHYSFAVLNRFLELPTSLVRGSPTFQLNQIVYACFTLYDFLSKMKEQMRNKTLNLISKIYWHLNHIGEKKNDATDTVGKIIKSLVDSSEKGLFEKPMSYTPSNSMFRSMSLGHNSNGNTPRSEFFNGTLQDFGDFAPLHDEISNDFSSDYFKMRSSFSKPSTSSIREGVSSNNNMAGSHNNHASPTLTNSTQGSERVGNGGVPDVGKFDTFEEFFKDMFNVDLDIDKFGS